MQKSLDFQTEETHLRGTLENISNQLKFVEKETIDIQSKYSKGLKLVQTADDRKDLNGYLKDANYESWIQRSKELEFQLKKPYFGRIIFEHSEADLSNYDIYIGRYSFLKNSPYKTVVDWRSPVAAIFYNYLGKNNKASFSFKKLNPESGVSETKTLEGKLCLRRKMNIEDGKMKSIHDISENVDLLDEVLENKTGGVLETIIESIQAEQDKIIREDIDSPLIIQGTAGSGKTTVAIHKVSYLFYNYKELLNQKNVLFLINSRVLAKYMRSALNDLDIDDPKIWPLHYTIVKTLEKFNDGYDYKYKQFSEIPSDFDYKKLITDIKIYSQELSAQVHQKIAKILGKSLFNSLNIRSNAAVYETIKDTIKELESTHDELVDKESEKSYPDFNNKSITKLLTAIKDLNELLNEFKLTSSYIKFLDAFGYKFTQDDKMYIYSMFLFAHELWRDAILGGKYNYTLVDEGQDYSSFEYEIISRLTYHSRVSVFGDINQGTTAFGLQKTDWDEVERILTRNAKHPAKFYNLKTSYRNTKETVEFNQNILKDFSDAKFLPQPYNRAGHAPTVIKCNSEKSMLNDLAQDLSEIQSTDFKSVCIINLGEQLGLSQIKSSLFESGVNIEIIDKSLKGFVSKTIYLCEEQKAKGLEFSSVFILDTDGLFSSTLRDTKSARRAYILSSRAINNLRIYTKA